MVEHFMVEKFKVENGMVENVMVQVFMELIVEIFRGELFWFMVEMLIVLVHG